MTKQTLDLLPCTLMHKNTPVIAVNILQSTGQVVQVVSILSERHVPIAIQLQNKTGIELKSFERWWSGRSIPASRDGIREALSALGEHSPLALVNKCYGLSLSDHYWLKPDHLDLDWQHINFFDNDFSEDIGNILLGQPAESPDSLDLFSPDNTSDGWLRKKWLIRNGQRCLLKGGSGDEQEPFNEVVATALMKRLGIAHVPYSLEEHHGKYYSLCPNFVTTQNEFIPAWQVMTLLKKSNEQSDYEHLIRCCNHLGMTDARAGLEQMLVLDYLIANEDRHYNNFGFIRSADTLAFQGCAPVFDSGTSLWYNTQNVGREVGAKPFKKTHARQITLVSNLSWFDQNALLGLQEEVMTILSVNRHLAQPKREAIVAKIMSNTEQIAQLATCVTRTIS